MEPLNLQTESGPSVNARPSFGKKITTPNSKNDEMSNINASPHTEPTYSASASSGMVATSCNNNNVNSGNENSIVIGGNTVDGMVVNAGGNVFVNINMTQGAGRSMNLDSLKEELPERSDHQQPYDTGVDKFDAESRFYCESIAPNSRSSLKRITPENLKNHVPESIHDRVMSYMCASDLFRSKIAIPLWRPSPSLYNSQTNQIRHWGKNVYIGDVGVFSGDGGFDTYFNIFETKEENESRGRTPPAHFVRYPKKLSEMEILSESHRGENDRLRIIGFVQDESSESGEHSTSFTIRFPPTPHKQKDASALHMLNGFLSIKMHSSDESSIKNYVRRQQTDWYESFKNVLDGRSLVVITTSYRAKAWASAAAKLSKKEGKLRLVHQKVEKKDVCSWVSGDADIFTKNGPSPDHIQKIESYFQALGDKSSRDEIEECHSVAVEAFYLHEKSSWIGGSTRSRRTTQTVASSRSKFSIKSFSTIKLFSRRAW